MVFIPALLLPLKAKRLARLLFRNNTVLSMRYLVALIVSLSLGM
jgi:hypothetical protein